MPSDTKVSKVPKVSKEKFYSIIYHDIFDYPLTEDESLRWEVGPFDFAQGKSGIQKTGRYYHLKGREQIVRLRQGREKESVKKLKLARKISTKLSTIPTIKFIGVTGSLAMKNSKEESDIDLMVITSSGTLWITRLIVRIVALFHGFMVRSAGGTESRNAVCFNMWLDEKHLEIPRKMRNLYTAHEVLQVVPLYNYDYTFEKFIDENKWTLEYWPSARKDIEIFRYRDTKGKFSKYLSILVSKYLWLFEPLAYGLQKLYMYPRVTRETIEPGRAFFHPVDWSKYVIREFNKRVDKYSLPLDITQTPVLK